MESNHWNTIYKLAEQYYKEKGNLLIPFRYTTIDKIQLGRWIGTQRGTYKKNKLSKDKIELLEKIGMVWDPLDAQWNECYELAKKYYKENGNLLIPHQYTINNIKLGRWIGTQRGLYKDNNLSRERILLLENIGIDWNPIDTQWNECYEIAKKYYNKYGNLLIPTDFIINNTNIGRWVATQRANYKLGVLTNYKTELLEDIGMIWEPYDTQWKEYYDLAKEYYKENGNLLISIEYTTNQDIHLGNWIHSQRRSYRENRLSKDKIELLEKIDYRRIK